MPLETIKQGESLPFEFDREGESIDGWTCTLNLKKYPDDTTLINRTVTPTDDTWSGYLTNNETKNLDVAQYTLIATLTNADEKEIQNKRFYVTANWS